MHREKMLQSSRALIITGGSSGIGKSFIEHAHRVNPELKIFNLSRSKPAIFTKDGNPVPLIHLACDFTNPCQVMDLSLELTGLLDRYVPVGRILLINNSGYGTYGPFPEPNLEKNFGMIDVNVRAPVELTGRLLPLLRQRGGAIINLASTAAFQPTPGMAVYGASKAFILSWSLALSEELRGTGVRVLALCPGPTSTQFFRNAGLEHPILPDNLGQTPEEVVDFAFKALARGKSVAVSGWKNRLGACMGSLFPKTLVTRISARVIAHFRPAKPKASRG
jgi:short-subunit dehydrogenase